MEEERPLFSSVLPFWPQDENAQSVLRGRDAGGRLNKPLASVVRAFPARKRSEANWPVRIRTLGTFSVTLRGKTVNFDTGAARHSLEFLKILIALGGRQVDAGSLGAAIRSQGEGFDVPRSVDLALSSLQDCLGERCARRLPDGGVSLDAEFCWVDAWDFEKTLDTVRCLLSEDVNGKNATRLEQQSGRLLELYQGHFLTGDDATSWSVSMRERLRMRFIRYLLDAGQYWESRGVWDKAVPCYQRGLEVDDLVEEFYQRLMACCLETRRISEGLAIYRRCRKVLSIVLGLQPAPETEALHYALMGAILGKQTGQRG
jgi:LuxR family maltose regulon positive regulatory protein